MADRCYLMRDRDAAYHHMVAGAEGMHIETLTDPHIALPRCQMPFRRGEMLSCRHLQILLAARTDQRHEAGRLRDRGVVGPDNPRHLAMRRQDAVQLKPLRGLSLPQS